MMLAVIFGVQTGPLARGGQSASKDQQNGSAWNNRLYGQYDYKKFATFKPANQPIMRKRVDRPLMAAAIFYATNEQRVQHDRKAFKFYSALADAAAEHSMAMVRGHFFSHIDPSDKARRTPDDRFKLHNVPMVAWAENIAKTFVDEQNGETYLQFARKMLKQWMNSSGHRKNILNPAFGYLGCGVASDLEKDGFFYIFATQGFSAAASAQ